MTHPRIRAQHTELTEIERTFRREHQSVRTVRVNLERHQAVLEGGDWMGRSARAFYAEMTGVVLPAMRRLEAALDRSAETTQRIAVRLREAEADAARVLTRSDRAQALINGSGAADERESGDRLFAREGSKDQILKGSTYQATNGHVFVDENGIPGKGGAHPSDINQGTLLGDCYLLATLAGLAAQQPELIERMVRANPDGTYTVTFYDKKGKPVDVTVTGDLPTHPGEQATAALGDRGVDGNPEVWVPIIEKAYAQYRGGYDVIGDGGRTEDAMQTVTGLKATRQDALTVSFNAFNQAFKEGRAIGLASLSKETLDPGFFDSAIPGIIRGSARPNYRKPYDDGTLVSRHAYYVVGVDEATQTVRIRNPWGWDRPELTMPYRDVQGHFEAVIISGKAKP